MSSKTGFNIASDGTEEQKRQYEDQKRDQRIRSIQTPELRKGIEDLKFRRNVAVSAEEEELKAQRARTARHIIDQRVPPHPEMNLRPGWARDMSSEAQRNTICKWVDDKYLPEHKRMVEEKRNAINKDIDREIELALDFEKSLEQNRTAERPALEEESVESKLEKLRENARDISQKLNRPRGPGRGRSR